ncbi:MAG TPA: hypothetical protein VEC99_06185, partial [Clostridia bacterium]|nr:hypothetical protein [Clostridia bacterium]
MKSTLTTVGLTALLIVTSYAGPDVIIRERAKQLRDQNNARQGVPPAARPAQPAVAPAAPPAPTVSPSLLQFQTELTAIKLSTPVP